MPLRAFKAAILIMLATVAVAVAVAATTTVQTIPPVVVSSSGSIAGCNALVLEPGNAVANQSGFIRAGCPGGAPAIILRGGETPTFILSAGFTRLTLMYYTSGCSLNTTLGQRLVGAVLTSGIMVTFSNSTSTTQLLAGGYDYCLFYQDPPITGILSFTVTWAP